MTYALVTVVHPTDYTLLRLQARSLSRYLRLDSADEIWVIANQGFHHRAAWQDPLRSDYGPLTDRVRFLDAPEVATIPDGTAGWLSQQILKLMVARVLTTDRYVVLDAKNHLVYPMSLDFFEVRGKLRSSRINYDGHSMRQFLKRSVRYFGIDEHTVVNSFLPTITPFVFPTATVRTLIDTIAERELDTFPWSFCGINTTEFMLFGGYLCSLPGGIEGVYDLSSRACPAIWWDTATRGADAVESVIARVEDECLPFFTVHRHAAPLLDCRSKEAVASLWLRRHLFDSVERGLRFLTNLGNCASTVISEPQPKASGSS
jgi:hypothetical protein